MHSRHQDLFFRTRLESWTPLRGALREYFTDSEIGLIESGLRREAGGKRRVFVLSFENDLVSLGGLGTVMQHFPRSLADTGEDVTVLTPLHTKHVKVVRAVRQGRLVRAGARVRGRCGPFSFSLQCFRDLKSVVPTYHLGMDGYFGTDSDPYHYGTQGKLLEDAVAFCCALPTAVAQLGPGGPVLFHANDWETALVALSSKVAVVQGQLSSAVTVLALHNSFDAELPDSVALRFLGRALPWRTVLQCSIPFCDGPLATVSACFAQELRSDPLQTGVFVPHLHEALMRNPPVGIPNGPFSTAKAPGEGPSTSLGLLRSKRQCLARLDKVLQAPDDPRATGTLKLRHATSAPLLLMSGRFDLAQKGFDVVFHAFRRLPRGSAKLLFSPSNPGSGSAASFEFFVDCARECTGDICIWPFRIPDDLYNDLVAGAGYLLMPSFYEPFGAATEGLLNGTPVVARGTGGLWEQVRSFVPCSLPSFYGRIPELLGGGDRRPNGILYREADAAGDTVEQWRRILTCGPRERLAVPLYANMVDSAHRALVEAIELFGHQEQYAQVAFAGAEQAGTPRWRDVASQYGDLYSVALRSW